MLLHWEIIQARPPRTAGGQGEPVATRARPSVHRIRSSGRASARAVGLESGKITGLGVLAAISRTIASVKAPAAVERPIRTVASTLRITSERPTQPRWVRGKAATSAAARA